MPFGPQVLVPGSELLGIRGTGRRGFAPEVRVPHTQDGIDHRHDGCAERLFGDEAATDRAPLFVTPPVFARTHACEACSCAYAVQTEEQALLERRPSEILPGRDTCED